MDKNQVMAMMSCQVDDNLNIVNTVNNGGFGTNTIESITTTTDSNYYGPTSCWEYWHQNYYPIIRESYPVYISERAVDKGKQAFEIIKMLKDKRFIKLETVGDFIDAMDALIKIL